MRPVSLVDAVGERRIARSRQRLDEAAEAFLAERFVDARRALQPLVKSAPDVPEVRELQGLILYREGKWEAARRELEAFYALTRDVSQHPVLMDCERALGNPAAVQELWGELGDISPDAATMTEGRIVAAGALADGGDLGGAVALLRKGFRRPGRPQEHHLRRAYALADLLERAGEVVAARELFTWIAEREPTFGDVAARSSSLG